MLYFVRRMIDILFHFAMFVVFFAGGVALVTGPLPAVIACGVVALVILRLHKG